MGTKIYIGTLAAIIWVAAIIGKHFWPDLDTGAIVGACFAVLTALGIFHVASGPADAPKPADATPVPAQPAAAAGASPVKPAEGGFAEWPLLVLIAGIVALAGAVSGCTSLSDAGHSSYAFEPVVIDGKTAYKFTAADGKEYSARVIKASLIDGGFTLEVTEGASTAFQGQAIAGKALSLLPSFAPVLLPPGPATLDVKP